MSTADFKQQVTNAIIDLMENDGINWTKTWVRSGMPRNLISGNFYSGGNVIALMIAASKKNYTSSYWLTFKQAQSIGANVKKGEKGTQLLFFKNIFLEDKETGEESKILMGKSFFVFNIDQVEGVPADKMPSQEFLNTDFLDNEQANDLILKTGAMVCYGDFNPCYVPSLDLIRMPKNKNFNTENDFYATIFHELAHWTGHTSRLDRDFSKSKSWGDEAYAGEELVAELAAAFFGAQFGWVNATIQGHASYLKSWLNVLKKDPNAIFQAATKASQAFDYLMSYSAENKNKNVA